MTFSVYCDVSASCDGCGKNLREDDECFCTDCPGEVPAREGLDDWINANRSDLNRTELDFLREVSAHMQLDRPGIFTAGGVLSGHV